MVDDRKHEGNAWALCCWHALSRNSLGKGSRAGTVSCECCPNSRIPAKGERS